MAAAPIVTKVKLPVPKDGRLYRLPRATSLPC